MTHSADYDAVREAVAEMVRDHTMPPKKDQHGYDYRMGWWDAVTYLDSLVKRRVREARVLPPGLPLHRTEAGWPNCSTCDGGGCLDCTDPA